MANHRSAVIPLIAARAPAPGVIGSSQNSNNMARGVVGSSQNTTNNAHGAIGSSHNKTNNAPGVIGSSHNITSVAPAEPTNDVSQSYAQDLWARYDHIKGTDDAKNALIEDVLSRYDSVMHQCQILIDAQNAREIHISRANQFSALLDQHIEYNAYLKNLLNANAFIVVIVDGNKFLFNDAFVRDGEEGGRKAAVILKDEVTEWISKSVEPTPSNFKVLIKVYADLKGLAGAYMRGGVIENMSTIGEFTQGFNTIFDFVDIGGGDVNSKVVDHFKLFLHDYTCHQVIFGGAPELLESNVKRDETLSSRAALLQSVPTDLNVPFKKVCFTKVFRTSNIIPSIATGTPRSGTPASTVESVSGNLPVPRTETPASAVGVSGNLPVPRSRNDSHASSIASATVPVPAVPTGKTWAKLAQDVATLPQTSTVPRPVAPTSRLHNKKGQRIDPPFLLDWEALKRVKQIKMCNMYYLHPKGCKFSEEKCNHRHDYTPTDAEVEILRSVSRENACRHGVGCDDPDCIYGHRCPYPRIDEGSMRGLACQMGDRCRFSKEMHGIQDATSARATNTGKR